MTCLGKQASRAGLDCSLVGGGQLELRRRTLPISFDLAPSTGAVVGDDLLEHRSKRGTIYGFVLPDGDRSRSCVVVSAGDDSFWIRDDGAVIEEYIDVILGCQQRTDVA